MAETFLVRVSVPREHAEVFEALLASLPEAVVGRQAPLIDTGVDLRDSDELIVLAYLDQPPETEAVAALIAMGERLCGLTGVGFDIETLPDIDWVAESQSALTAIHAGRFFLRGSHDPSPVPRALSACSSTRRTPSAPAITKPPTAVWNSSPDCCEPGPGAGPEPEPETGTARGPQVLTSGRLWGVGAGGTGQPATMLGSDIDRRPLASQRSTPGGTGWGT